MAEVIRHMRMDNPWNNNHLIVVDDESLFQVLRQHPNLNGEETAIGAAFALCYKKQTPHAAYYLLYQAPENAHLHLYLALSVLAKHTQFQTVIALGKGLGLSKELSTDKPVLITEARACSYPALYQNEDPYTNHKPQIDTYAASPIASNWIGSNRKITSSIQTVAGYCKHPVHNGSLLPWAPEQFMQLGNQGIHIYSEIPAAIYDTGNTSITDQTAILAFCVITKTLDAQLSNPTKLANWLQTTQQQVAYNKSTGSTSTIS